MTAREQMLVAWIRAKCAREFECERDYPFFNAHAVPGETADETILRVFNEEKLESGPTGATDDEILAVMIHG